MTAATIVVQPTDTPEAALYDDFPVKGMIYPAILFMIIGMFMGTFMAFNAFVFPDYFSGEYIHFGVIRPIHVGTVAWLWLLSANIGLFYFFVPRLCGVPLWSSKLAYLSMACWWPALIIGQYSYPFGTNSGWEYAELPQWVGWFPVKPLFTFSWVLIVINLYATIATRRFQKMYVSLWYVMGTLLWTTFTWMTGAYGVNWVPEGISRVHVNFFYVHNLVGLIFTPMGLAAAYYFLPKLANTPIYSHKLSMVGFWALAFTYSWIGTHHILHGPISQWLQTVSIMFSIWLLIPVFSVVHNIFMTLLPQWNKYSLSPPLRFIMMGNIFYLITCIQGPTMALRNVNEITSKTDWVIGHAHISLYATFTFFAIAGIYYVIPAITRKPLWSVKMAEWHFALNMIGTIPFIASLWVGGYLQGMLWSNWADGTTYAEFHRALTQMTFIDTIAETYPWWVMRAVGGLIILCANILFAINMYNTIMLPARAHQKVVTNDA